MNERLAATLREARDQIVSLKEEINRLAQPPAGFGVFLGEAEDGAVDVFTGGRKLRVRVSPTTGVDELRPGQEVMLNEALNVVQVLAFENVGELVMLQELLADGARALVLSRADEERVVRLADPLRHIALRAGDSLLLEPRSGFVLERVPRSDVETLILEDVPDTRYEDIGGLALQIEQIRDAIELPRLHPDMAQRLQLTPPRGVLLYGPPGCGKTLIAKALAASLARRQTDEGPSPLQNSYFLYIKGPELLNKYVGETERHIRLIFQRARAKATDGAPVICFFDEMDSLFRTRGSGVSSDVENTIVPQLLSELDGIEQLKNVVVIGATNREDMIDPAILRPGRLDMKIKVGRPNAGAAKEIFSKYLASDLPISDSGGKCSEARVGEVIRSIIDDVVAYLYGRTTEMQFVEAQFASGEEQTLYFGQFMSGAVIKDIVDRSKLYALRRATGGEPLLLRKEDVLNAARAAVSDQREVSRFATASDWERIAGGRGEPIVFARVLDVEGAQDRGGRSIDVSQFKYG